MSELVFCPTWWPVAESINAICPLSKTTKMEEVDLIDCALKFREIGLAIVIVDQIRVIDVSEYLR